MRANTEFNITLTKGNGEKYHVNLGESLLDGLTQSTIEEHAESDLKVCCQNDTKLKLREAVDGNDLQNKLRQAYPAAVVTTYVPSSKPVAKVKEIELAAIRETIARVKGVHVSAVTHEEIMIIYNDLHGVKNGFDKATDDAALEEGEEA